MEPVRFAVGAYFLHSDAKGKGRSGSPLVFEEELSSILADPQSQETFVQSLKEFAGKKEISFIGVAEDFTPLAQRIRKETPLDIKVGVRCAKEHWEKLPSFDAYVSCYDLLAFDYYAPQEGQAANFHAALPNIRSSVKEYSGLGIPMNKMNLGLSAIGKVFTGVPPGAEGNGYEQPCKGAQPADPDISYAAIETYLRSNPSAKVFHTAIDGILQSFLYNPANGDWISFDDPDTLKAKAAWGQRQGLGGVFLWGADGDNSEHAEFLAVASWNSGKHWTKI